MMRDHDAAISRFGTAASCCSHGAIGGVFAPSELGAVAPHTVKDDDELPCDPTWATAHYAPLSITSSAWFADAELKTLTKQALDCYLEADARWSDAPLRAGRRPPSPCDRRPRPRHCGTHRPRSRQELRPPRGSRRNPLYHKGCGHEPRRNRGASRFETSQPSCLCEAAACRSYMTQRSLSDRCEAANRRNLPRRELRRC